MAKKKYTTRYFFLSKKSVNLRQLIEQQFKRLKKWLT